MEIEQVQLAFDGLLGNTVTRTSLDQWSVTILFDESEIFVEGQWILTDGESRIIDRSTDLTSRTSFELWRVVGLTVQQVKIAPEPPYNVRVEAANGYVLTIFADADGYEDWTYSSPSRMIICNDTILTQFRFS